ncbi:hypothetical protein H6F96_14110 [Microcoleus sp. FACHB-53]|nr:hypothetical protein [Microcoleus sp. FACHB-53]
MPKSLTIATWNLERPRLGGWKKNGDFNQTLSDPTGYGTHQGRNMLSEALQKNDLVCVTDKIQFNIDHICFSKDWAERVNQVTTGQCFTPDGKPVSDHQGIYVNLF